MRPVVLILTLCVLAAGCRTTASGPDELEARQMIADRAAGFSAAYVAGDVDALLDYYTDAGMAAPGGRDFASGTDALRELWTLPEGRTIIRHATRPTKIVIDGDHAYDWGYYEGQAAQDGEPLEPFRGKYLIVWERGDDGVWRMAADMWNSLGSE